MDSGAGCERPIGELGMKGRTSSHVKEEGSRTRKHPGGAAGVRGAGRGPVHGAMPAVNLASLRRGTQGSLKPGNAKRVPTAGVKERRMGLVAANE